MKKINIFALLVFLAASAKAQIIDFAYHLTSGANPLNGGVQTTYVGPYSGTPVLGDLIYFNGTNWVSLSKPADGTYSIKFTASVPSYIAASGTTIATDPTWTAAGQLAVGTGNATGHVIASGTGLLHQAGAADPTWSAVVGSDMTNNTVGNSQIRQGGANSVIGVAGNATANVADIAATTAGQDLKFDGTNLAFRTYPVDPATEAVLFEDFFQKYPTGGTSTPVALGACYAVGSGTASGLTAVSGTNAVNADTNHIGIARVSTGSTTTGMGSLNCGNSNNDSTDTIVIAGGEIIEWMVYVPVASTGTDTHKVWIGLCDNISSNAECTDALDVYWDNNADTHWGCQTANNSSRTSTISTTVATAAAWHKIRIEVNSNATSVAFKVDGSALSCSPLATNIPTGNTRGTGLQLRIAASAGCAAAGTCTAAADYVYFRKAVTR